MKTNLMYLAAALLLAACAPKVGNTTKVVGQFSDDAPKVVEVTMGLMSDRDIMDTTFLVHNGRFEFEIPKDLTAPAVFRTGYSELTFLSDGSTITVDPEAGTAVSNNKKGPQSRFVAYNEWMDQFTSDYRAKMAEFAEDEDAAEAYYEETMAAFNKYQKEAAKANADNIVGLYAITQLQMMPDNYDEIVALLDGLSDEIKAIPVVGMMREEFVNKAEATSRTGEGSPFVDFVVIQDPENPETSAVKLSDYIGKGKYVLVDFWASWCGPCLEEMPNLVNVYNTYHGDNFDMLSVAVMDEPEDSAEAAKEYGIVWNQIVNAQEIPAKAYGIDAIPHIILFGPDGTILKRNLRGDKVEEAVKEALGL